MEPNLPTPRNMHRITFFMNPRRTPELLQWLSSVGVGPVYRQNGRTVRQRQSPRKLLPGTVIRLEDSPVGVFHCTVDSRISEAVIEGIYEHGQLSIPGRGSFLLQKIREYQCIPKTEEKQADSDEDALLKMPDSPRRIPGTLQRLSLLTFILSMPGSSERIAQIGLNLGTAVPLITLGEGTGIRDRLGLLRITVPAHKEIVQMLIPEIDKETIILQSIEKARLNRAGQGFLFTTPVYMGLPDTRLRIGHQDHAASMDQIIASLDEIYKNTSWRRRVSPPGSQSFKIQTNNTEIRFICPEGYSAEFVESAIEAGARGATTLRQSKRWRMSSPENDAAREQTVLTVDSKHTQSIIEALWHAQEPLACTLDSLQTLPSTASYTHGG